MSYDIGKIKKNSDFISDILYVRSCESTNLLAKQRAAAGAKEGFLVLADHQTGGRGRLGRSWYHQGESAVAMSIILRPSMKTEDVSGITLVAAIAVHDAIKDVAGLDTQIKWPNDILYNGKKICGILTEGVIDGTYLYAVLGIGINVNSDYFPIEYGLENASSIKMNTGVQAEREDLIIGIVNRFKDLYGIFQRDGDMRFLKGAYNDSAMSGNRIDGKGNRIE